jgi:hypothetical protein
LLSLALLLLACLAAGPAYAGTCTNPTGNEADEIYNEDYHTYQFCNGTNWTPFGTGGTIGYSGGGCSNPTGNEADEIYNGDYHTYQF